MTYDAELQKIYYDRNPEAYLKRSRANYRKNRVVILAKKKVQYEAKRIQALIAQWVPIAF